MQEEIEHKTVNFAISTAKLSARTLLRGAQFFLRQYDKSASQGKQSMKRLIRQNRGVTNLEIEKTGIKDFDRCAKRYHIDYAIQKDLSCTPPRFLIFFKAQDADALNAAFKEYSAAVLNKAERPSVLAKLHDLAQVIANLPDKVRHKEEERGLYDAYRKSGYCSKFLEAHREEVTLHKTAKAAFNESGLKKLPKVKDLNAEYSALLTKKKALYPEYRKARDEMQDIVKAQKNVELFFAEEKDSKEKEQIR